MITPTLQEFASEVANYASDPNCFPDLWIKDSKPEWSHEAVDMFVQVGVEIKKRDGKWRTVADQPFGDPDPMAAVRQRNLELGLSARQKS